ncbi:hypothetical protein HMPREF0083_03204, partial [Aneurinibacillus aneurinilyticus ATCC 12856]
ANYIKQEILSGRIKPKENYALENPGFHRTRMTLQDMGVHTVSI